MTVVQFPVLPARSIEVRKLADGRFVGVFLGDAWTPSFRTGAGSHWLVMDALRKCRQGLPIEVSGVRHWPYPAGFAPRFVQDPFALDPDPRPAA